MSAFRRILVLTDGSAVATRAIAMSVRLARMTGATLLFFHCVDVNGADTARVLAHARAQAADAHVDASAAHGRGAPVDAILDVLAGEGFDAIVMGSHGHNDAHRLALGSTAHGVLRRASIPVFVISVKAELADQSAIALRAVEVAFDDSEPAASALALALELATPRITRVIIARCIDLQAEQRAWVATHEPGPPPVPNVRDAQLAAIGAATDEARRRNFEAESFLLTGQPVVRLVEIARLHRVDLIAIGLHGRRAGDRTGVGSITRGVLRDALVPVVVVPVPPTADRS